MSYHSIDVDVRVNGKTIKQHTHKNRVFIEARQRSEYTVNVKNNDWKRVLVVCTVDGINVVNGEAGGKSQAGYVVNGYSSVDIKGWRSSNDDVHPFKFNLKEKSYAAKAEQTNGDASNAGVIGIQVYAEKEKPAQKPIVIREDHYHEWPRPWIYPVPCTPVRPSYPYLGDITWTVNSMAGQSSINNSLNGTLRCASFNASSNGGAVADSLADEPVATASVNFVSISNAAPKGFDMGTEWSKEAVQDKVHEVEFETGQLLTTFNIYYASHESLVEMGVPFTKQTQVSLPQAFPSKFCKPPRD